MSVRQGLLALLEAGPIHGYGLKSDFEKATGDMWPLNVGQVYSTLSRLERDGLVSVEIDQDGQKVYELTPDGRAELAAWYSTPVEREAMPREELALKLVLVLRSGSVDVSEVLQAQRVATMRWLQELTSLKAGADPEEDLAWLLMLDGLIFQAESEVRWLDHCEARLAGPRSAGRRRRSPQTRRAEEPVR